jgi:hypothetical protein
MVKRERQLDPNPPPVPRVHGNFLLSGQRFDPPGLTLSGPSARDDCAVNQFSCPARRLCQHSLRVGSRSQRCARARSEMIWAFSAVSLVRFCSWALSSEEYPSSTQPTGKTVKTATKPRRVTARWPCEMGNLSSCFPFGSCVPECGGRPHRCGPPSPCKMPSKIARTWRRRKTFASENSCRASPVRRPAGTPVSRWALGIQRLQFAPLQTVRARWSAA